MATTTRPKPAPGICPFCLIRPKRAGGGDCSECHAQREKDRRHRRKRTRRQLRTLILRATTLARVDELMAEMIERGELRVKP